MIGWLDKRMNKPVFMNDQEIEVQIHAALKYPVASLSQQIDKVYPVGLKDWLTPCDIRGLEDEDRVLGEEPRLGLLGDELLDTAEKKHNLSPHWSTNMNFYSS